MDKVIFFGYRDVIEQQRKTLERFLKKRCGVQIVTFHEVPYGELKSSIVTMRSTIQNEKEQGNQLFFDITGGESPVLVAFGMLYDEFQASMHMYDIPNDRLIELDDDPKRSISLTLPQKEVPMSLDLFIELHGGIINHHLEKDTKGDGNAISDDDIEKIYSIAKQNKKYWNAFSGILSEEFRPFSVSLTANASAAYVRQSIRKRSKVFKSLSEFDRLLKQLAEAGILQELQYDDVHYSFLYKSLAIKECLWEGGCILELYTYRNEMRNASESRVGVHIDWDGVICSSPIPDVRNEIDVLSFTGKVLTFISCKSGDMRPNEILHALYELDTVARRFGGKYAKKVLVTAFPIGGTHQERAKEMGIELR